MNTRSDLRQAMRARRAMLSAPERRLAARGLAHTLVCAGRLWRAQRVAAYLAHRGEIDPAPLVRALWRMGKDVYLPRLDGDSLVFVAYTRASRMGRNKFGIPEPDEAGGVLDPAQLDVVLMPLVAFDGRGNRLGMGGGYYDRAFAFLRERQRWRVPRLLGLAYEFQHVASLPAEDWDVPVAAVATDRRLRWFG